MFGIHVTQFLNPPPEVAISGLLYLCTKHTPPGFVLLKCIEPRTLNLLLTSALQNINGYHYLSSNIFIETWTNSFSSSFKLINFVVVRQGPSMETRHEREDRSQATDQVWCIHCDFWPIVATEWLHRPRQFGWPSSRDIDAIKNFGCHLVPIGHPHSHFKLVEWRLSFSIAEKLLVWSFNHVQIQCYAVMKLVLKEFIKVKCNPENQVLCSYFVKTFLFWQFEKTDVHFWQKDNFGNCIAYLLRQFFQCLREGVLRHYFIPGFNLLSVKLTAGAQTELLQLLDIVIQYNVSVMKECKSLRIVWSKFVQANENQQRVILNSKRMNLLMTDKLLIKIVDELYSRAYIWYNFNEACIRKISEKLPLARHFLIPSSPLSMNQIICRILTIPTRTHLDILVVKRLILEENIRASLAPNPVNRDLCHLHRLACNESLHFDISASKIWYAIALLNKKYYESTVCLAIQILSSIPPYALCSKGCCYTHSADSRHLYADMFLDSDISIPEKARMAWMFEIVFKSNMSEKLPLAFQIELYFSKTAHNCICVSPHMCLYYIMFLCYHELRQYDQRDRALRQLTEHMTGHSLSSVSLFCHHSFNIAGHCLLIAGDIARARDMFSISKMFSSHAPFSNGNSAAWYLQHFC